MPRRTTLPPPLPSAADYLDRLRELVEADGSPQAHLAERIGTTRQSLHRSLSGRDLPLSRLVEILAGLDPPRTLADMVRR